MNTRQWLHSPYYWNIWVFSFSFWFIFYRLCKNHYRASSTIFFSPFNAYFSLLTMCVHSLVMCANHNNSSMGCCTWLGSSSLPHIIISGPMSLADLWHMTTFLSQVFVIIDHHFITMDPICIGFFPYFLLIVCFCFFFGLCLLVLSFALYFWWMDSCPWFLYTWYFFVCIVMSTIKTLPTYPLC